MECKYKLLRTVQRRRLELIDTLWNVNDVETDGELNDLIGINRYIMECKWYCTKNGYI